MIRVRRFLLVAVVSDWMPKVKASLETMSGQHDDILVLTRCLEGNKGFFDERKRCREDTAYDYPDALQVSCMGQMGGGGGYEG